MIGALLRLVPLILVLLWCYYRWRYHRTLSIASKLYTGLPSYPIVGHLPYVIFNPDYFDVLLRFLKSMPSDGYQSGCLWVGPFPYIAIGSPEDIHTILTSSNTAEKSMEYSFFKTGLGNGLATALSHTNKITRRHFNPLFTIRNLEQHEMLFNNSARHLIQGLSQYVDQGLVDILPLVNRIALRNVSCVLFGPDVDIEKYTEEIDEMIKTLKRIGDLLLERLFKLWLWSDFLFQYLWSKEIKEIHKGINKYADIPQKADNDTLNLHDNHIHESKLTLLDTFKNLQENYPDFTEHQWRDEVTTLAFTGTDSSKIVISHGLLLLALNPDVQDKLYQEVTSVVGVEDKDITFQDINKMPYLDQVFKETIRHSCVVPIIARSTAKDIQLKDFTVPAGNTILVSIASLNYNPEVFPNPYKFDPDHFAPEKVSQMKRYSFIPFSGGARNCIGNNYASTFNKIAITQVLRKYYLSSTVDISKFRHEFGIGIYSKDGYHLQLKHRRPLLNHSLQHTSSK